MILLLLAGCGRTAEPPVLHVALPWSDYVTDVNSNYYIRYLEQRTGLKLECTLIRHRRSEEYLDALFSSEADIDVVMFGNGFQVTREELEAYGDALVTDQGVDHYINSGSVRRSGVGQILWINSRWLMKLGLSIPSTTGELRDVLRAFRDGDPNGNGLADEIPFTGCGEGYAWSPAEFLLNSFVYNDPYHSRYGVNDEADTLMAGTDAFREGLSYVHDLYAEGLIDPAGLSMSGQELCELVNSPADLVGAFTTASISDVIYPGNPEILAKYVHVAPLAGPDGTRNALYVENTPSIGAIITARSTKKKEAALLLETMLEEEASLIARFGEEGVDWDFSEGTDVSVYGGPSTIVTRNYLWNTVQNKHLNGIGPMNVPERYIEGVTWNGINSDTEYINGHAEMSYQTYLPVINRLHERDQKLSEKTDAWLIRFIRGEKDIRSDRIWQAYLDELAH